MPNGETKVLRGVAGAGKLEVLDVGDIEVIKLENEIMAILPVGKSIYLIGKHGLLAHPTRIRKLKDMT